ncbi:MAG: hypothetical protein PVS3B3_34020 [Ktedonobacteraceae bacterium]
MAGRYAKKEIFQEPLDSYTTQSAVPARATRQLPAIQTQQLEVYDEIEEEDFEGYQLDRVRYQMRLALDNVRLLVLPPQPLRCTLSTAPAQVATYRKLPTVVDEYAVLRLERLKPWLYRSIRITVVVVIALGVLLSAAILQRPGEVQLINLPGIGNIYVVQLGGTHGSQVQQTSGSVTSKGPLHIIPTVAGNPPPITFPTSQYVAIARQDALNVGIPPDYFLRQIYVESGFNPDAASPAGAVGIAQFEPATAAGLGINPYDPVQALSGAARLMASYVIQYDGEYAKALAAYNAGSGRLNRAVRTCGTSWLACVPAETQNYIYKIMGI